MNHGLPQVFGIGLALRLAKRDSMGRPIICQNQRMVHGDVGGTLLEIAYRVASCGHDVAQELIRFRHCAGGAIHEVCLDLAPGILEARTIGGRERLEVETFDPFRALFEPGLRASPVTAFLYGAGSTRRRRTCRAAARSGPFGEGAKPPDR